MIGKSRSNLINVISLWGRRVSRNPLGNGISTGIWVTAGSALLWGLPYMLITKTGPVTAATEYAPLLIGGFIGGFLYGLRSALKTRKSNKPNRQLNTPS